MASLELQRLWKLNQIDAGIADIRTRAAALDPSRALRPEIETLTQQEAEVGGAFRALHAEQTDLELAQKGIEDKLKKIDKELYGGKVVNPREVENYEKEIAALKKQRNAMDDRLLELMELIPPAQKKAEQAAARLTEKKRQLAVAKKTALETKEQLEAEYARLSKARPDALKGISPNLMARYDAIRKSHGTGMAEILGRRSCSGCGTLLPERSIVSAQDDKVVTCETCHRILYYTEGVV